MKYLIRIILLVLCQLSRAAVIGGYVSDSGNGERLSYANVVVIETQTGEMTGREGSFSISGLKPGEYTLQVTCLGYGSIQRRVTIKDELDDHYIMVELSRQALKMAGSEVSGSTRRQGINLKRESSGISLGKMQLRGELIQGLPQAADADVIRSLQVLPGVQTVNETSNGLYVRGGTPDQNLILLDDTEVYNPSHLGGIFSTFNSDAIASVDLYKAGFPSRYGDRLSSVLDIRNRDGNRKRMEGTVRLSMMSGSATMQGPWQAGRHKGSWMGSFRRTIYELMGYDMPESYFYDGHLKLNWDAGLRDKIFISSYFGKDYLHMEEGEDMKMNWGNNTLTGQWLHVFNSQVYGKFNLARSSFNFDVKQIFDGEKSVQQENWIDDLSFKADIKSSAVEDHEFEIGAELKRLEMIFGAETDLDINTAHYPWLEVPSWQSSLYAQDSWLIAENWRLQPGLRATWCRTTSEYHPSRKKEDYWRFSPRLALRWQFSDNLDFAWSYGRYYQYLTAANRTDWPMSLWLPIDASVQPGAADHYVAGLQAWLGEQLNLEMEIYYKSLRNQISLDEDTFMEWSDGDYLSEAYQIGNGFAWGAEILLGSVWQGMEGFFSYTYSRCRLKVNDHNINPATGKAEYFYPQHDRTHNVNLIENYHFSDHTGRQLGGADVTLGIVYSFGSGQPDQAPEGIYQDMYGWQFVEGYLDNVRLPDYSRLDISLKFKWQLSEYSIEPYFMVVNALDNRNIWTRDWYTLIEDSEAKIAYKDTYMFNRMPFLGINIQW